MQIKANELRTDLRDTEKNIDVLLKAYDRATGTDAAMHSKILELRTSVLDLKLKASGSKARSEVGEKSEFPTIGDYLWPASGMGTTYGPTKTQIQCLNNASALHDEIRAKLDGVIKAIDSLKPELEKIGAPKVR